LAGFIPFPADRAEVYRATGHWAGRPLDAILRDAAASWPERTAVIDARGVLKYDDLDRRADRAAAGMRALGIMPGDRVLLQLPNCCEFAITFFGLLRAGAIPVMCLPAHRDAELGHFLDVADAVGIVIADTAGGFDYRGMAERLAASHPALRHVIVDGDPGPHTAWTSVCDPVGLQTATSPAPPPRPAANDPALLLVSGGTTGAPKLIPRTHDDYVYNATASARLCGLTGDDVYLVSLPAGHNFPLACPGILGAFSVGATVVFGTDPSPEAAFSTVRRHGVTVTALVPALARLWAQACQWEPEPPKSLRLLQVGGAKLAPADARDIRSSLTPGLQQVFGMAEGLVCYTRLDDTAEIIEQTQGRPLSTHDEVRVIDDDGIDVPIGASGELLVRGPYTINGYFRAERDNSRSFSPDGFYRTGDLVRRLADGYLEVTGRVKDVIQRSGETVSALALEEHLLTHPAVDSVAAVGLPDDYLGEKICVAVIFNAHPVTLAELNRHLDTRGVATHARPDMVVAMSTLPTTAVGKVDKRALAAALGGQRSANR
jgi:mycobactin salicyl-AMP ligase